MVCARTNSLVFSTTKYIQYCAIGHHKHHMFSTVNPLKCYWLCTMNDLHYVGTQAKTLYLPNTSTGNIVQSPVLSLNVHLPLSSCLWVSGEMSLAFYTVQDCTTQPTAAQ